MKKMTFMENLFYYVTVVATLGGAYIMKCIIKKAIVDSHK